MINKKLLSIFVILIFLIGNISFSYAQNETGGSGTTKSSEGGIEEVKEEPKKKEEVDPWMGKTYELFGQKIESDPFRSLYAAIFVCKPVCVSGIVYQLRRYAAIDEEYNRCLEIAAKTGASSQVCDEFKSAAKCQFIWGQVWEATLGGYIRAKVHDMFNKLFKKGGVMYKVANEPVIALVEIVVLQKDLKAVGDSVGGLGGSLGIGGGWNTILTILAAPYLGKITGRDEDPTTTPTKTETTTTSVSFEKTCVPKVEKVLKDNYDVTLSYGYDALAIPNNVDGVRFQVLKEGSVRFLDPIPADKNREELVKKVVALVKSQKVYFVIATFYDGRSAKINCKDNNLVDIYFPVDKRGNFIQGTYLDKDVVIGKISDSLSGKEGATTGVAKKSEVKKYVKKNKKEDMVNLLRVTLWDYILSHYDFSFGITESFCKGKVGRKPIRTQSFSLGGDFGYVPAFDSDVYRIEGYKNGYSVENQTVFYYEVSYGIYANKDMTYTIFLADTNKDTNGYEIESGDLKKEQIINDHKVLESDYGYNYACLKIRDQNSFCVKLV